MTTVKEGLGQGLKGLLLFVLIGAVIISALSVVYVKHQTRQYFAKMQNLQRTSEDLHVEWSQLLVEQGTWASDARVEKIARQQLKMVLPKPQEVVVIRQ